MITFSIIQKSQLEGAERIDAEYYQSEYLKLIKEVRDFHNKTLKEITVIRSGTTPTDRDDKLNEGIILLKTTDIRNNPLSNNSSYYHISSKIASRMSKTKLEKKDVLINIVGATLDVIGRASLVPSNFPEANITQAMALLRIKDHDYLPEYIFSFLLSKYGQFQKDRLARPTGQYNLNLDELGQIIVPQASLDRQKILVEFIQESIFQQEEAVQLYQYAEDLLLKELRLNNFQPENNLSYIVNFSEVKNADRIDADFFQPKYKDLIAKLKTQNARLLRELVSMKKGFEPGSEAYQEEGKLFIRVSSLSKFGIETTDQKYLDDELYQKLQKEYQPQVGEILLTKDATPGIAYVIKEPIEGIISGGLLRLKMKGNIDPEYLALCINSLIGQMQAERDAGGSIIIHWKPEQIENLFIPILPKEKQLEIAELVKESHEARKKSKELLDQAKREVEEMIEKGAN